MSRLLDYTCPVPYTTLLRWVPVNSRPSWLMEFSRGLRWEPACLGGLLSTVPAACLECVNTPRFIFTWLPHNVWGAP